MADLVPMSQAATTSLVTTLQNTDLFALAREDNTSETGYRSKVSRVDALAKKVVNETDYSQLQTTDKKIIGAINEVNTKAKDTLSDLTDTTITTPSNADLLAYDSSTSKWVNTDLKGTASGSIATFSNGGDDIPCQYMEVWANVGSAITSFNVVRSGINACDEVFESGGINTQGNNTVDNTRIRTANYCPCAEIEYYVVVPTGKTVAFRFYRLDKTHISDGNITMTSSGTMTPPTDACYFRLVILDTTAYNNDLSVNVPSTYQNYIPSDETQDYTITLPTSMTNFMVDLISGKGTDFSTHTNFTITPIKVDTLNGTTNIYATIGDVMVGYFTEKANNIAELIKAFL